LDTGHFFGLVTRRDPTRLNSVQNNTKLLKCSNVLMDKKATVFSDLGPPTGQCSPGQ